MLQLDFPHILSMDMPEIYETMFIMSIKSVQSIVPRNISVGRRSAFLMALEMVALIVLPLVLLCCVEFL